MTEKRFKQFSFAHSWYEIKVLCIKESLTNLHFKMLINNKILLKNNNKKRVSLVNIYKYT